MTTVGKWWEAKLHRTRHFFRHVYGWRKRPCTACNGSGHYDNDGSPDCSGCDGTGVEMYPGPLAYSYRTVNDPDLGTFRLGDEEYMLAAHRDYSQRCFRCRRPTVFISITFHGATCFGCVGQAWLEIFRRDREVAEMPYGEDEDCEESRGPLSERRPF